MAERTSSRSDEPLGSPFAPSWGFWLWWVLASTVGWVVGGFLSGAFDGGFAGWATIGAVYGAITGMALVLLLRQ
jgi:hypothetical protein